MKHSFDSITLKKSSFTKNKESSTLKSTKSPRNESFLQMVHFSVAPLLKVSRQFQNQKKNKSFTSVICMFDILFYLATLALQLFMNLEPLLEANSNPLRPTQIQQFYMGQLYPYYVQKEFNIWRLLLSLEMYKNEIHIFLSLLFKAHFCSFIEHFFGWKRIAIIYGVAGISSTLGQCIYSNNPGHDDTGISFTIENNMQPKTFSLLEQASPSEQLQYFYDYQLSQDVVHSTIKMALVFTVFGVMSIKVQQILFIGSFIFALQVHLLSFYFLSRDDTFNNKTKTLCIVVDKKQVECEGNQYGFIWLALSILLIIVELILLCFIIDTKIL